MVKKYRVNVKKCSNYMGVFNIFLPPPPLRKEEDNGIISERKRESDRKNNAMLISCYPEKKS